MKKLIALVLALLLVLSVSALAEGELPIGRLYSNGESEAEAALTREKEEGNKGPEQIFFDNLTSLLMALSAGRVGRILIPEPVALYIVARNDNIAEPVVSPRFISLCMAVSTENTELLGQLNTAIAVLKQSGEIDALYEASIANLASDPVPTELPLIEGAQTVRIAVTGDLPPFDYVSAGGEPAGFNIELLSAISKLTNLNFELVMADAGSRAAMLASGRADIIFWMQRMSTSEEGGERMVFIESAEGITLTDDYVKVSAASLALK